MRHRTAWQALGQNPLKVLGSSWPWRSLAYLLSGVVFGSVITVVLVLVLAAGLVGLVVLVGAVVLVGVALSGVAVTRIERWRLRLVDLDPVPDPHRAPERPGLVGWVRTRLWEPATWRELGFTAVSATALWWMDLLVLVFALGLPVSVIMSPLDDPGAWPLVIVGLCLLAAAPYTITAWAGARAAVTRLMLAPRDSELGRELTDVRASRARLVDAFDAERRRIERDLHDGAQQRLVSLNVLLGLARLDAAPESPLAGQLARAQEQVTLAVEELRELSRGVHPKALTDQGLEAAVENLAARSALPVTVDISLPHRMPVSVETTAYFVIAEALTNAVKHSRADRVEVHARLHTDVLTLTVTDNGIGGAERRTGADPHADPAPETGALTGPGTGGTGLVGLADRVAAADGRLRLSSPPGGPTFLHVELPCR
ncbi:sensor histidine kinase [Streptomyces ipomoeae]|uniref:histidine kinase n=2 Tax=Streptomyces ipomoeae TaxID=103232 RepID=L1KRX6_9ACTN|nr:sensor histidine kinase [Streptomyces ipomoeae]EKX63279.1 ATPase/histidine kinase/DNA gyrase B/HSP90 domain protein [Streptomyces ipomoeae 91-03]MDX2700090.1 sensor domain-containing protein [Streptomyces ipomoeae]MDX2842417.1 sensor domain-containing protein [Streptomyces ipomoeae]TQE28713.1 sensor histidine kinase [Streptomyces ipomoeae]TQE32627.1 sensor histidine kinase [Streptomyces ipomoeae]